MLVTEFCDHGDLRRKLSSQVDGDRFLWRDRGRAIMLQVSTLCHIDAWNAGAHPRSAELDEGSAAGKGVWEGLGRKAGAWGQVDVGTANLPPGSPDL